MTSRNTPHDSGHVAVERPFSTGARWGLLEVLPSHCLGSWGLMGPQGNAGSACTDPVLRIIVERKQKIAKDAQNVILLCNNLKQKIAMYLGKRQTDKNSPLDGSTGGRLPGLTCDTVRILHMTTWVRVWGPRRAP